MEITTQAFPPKPAEPPVKDAWGRSAISLLLFVTLYYFTFDRSPKYIAMLVGVLLLHEMGHFIAMRIRGLRHLLRELHFMHHPRTYDRRNKAHR
jgi:hypothetical protein